MLRFTRATQRTRLLLVVVVAFTLLFICGVADDNDWGAVTRPAPATAPEERARERAREAANKGGALSSAAAARSDSPLLEQRAVLDGRRLAVVSRGGSDDSSAAAASVAAVGMVHPEVVEGAAVWQGQAVTVVGLLGLTVFAVIVAVVGRKLYRSRRERRNGVSGSGCQQASTSAAGATRSRLFSRDRLNTTDYMHTLATLDRRLAMDEILEKRRRAVFLQQIRCHAPGDEDDVFLEEGLFCPEPSSGSRPPAPANVDDTASSSGSRLQQHALL